jgi:aryl-alcohol dehydrogenase-like predicted oxidoreductase
MVSTISIGETEVPRIGFGTLYITVERGFGAARPDAVALLREAARLGVRFFDTADSYGSGSAEEAIH